MSASEVDGAGDQAGVDERSPRTDRVNSNRRRGVPAVARAIAIGARRCPVVGSRRCSNDRLPGRSPTPPAATSSRTPTAGSSTSARPSRCAQRLSQLLPEPAQPAAAHRADGGHRRVRRVDPGPQRRRGADARVQPHQAAPAPLQRPAGRRQELPVPGRHRRRRVAPAHGHAGRASARASATSGPTPTPTPSARRSTCCCARSRCAPARTTSSAATSGSAGRACCSTSRSARARASARSTTSRLRRAASTSSSSSSTATPTPVVAAPRGRDARGGRRARVRAGRPAARPAGQRCARPSSASRWWATATRTSTSSASPRTSSRPPSRSSSCARAGWWAARASSLDKVEDLDRRRAHRPRCSRASTATRRRSACPRQVLVPTEPDDADLYERVADRAAGLAGRRSACPSGATSASCWRRSPRTPPRSSPATGCGGPSDHNSRAQALNELQEYLGLPDAPLRIECYDMSHLQGTDYVGSMVVLEDGLPEEVRVPPLQDQERRTATTTSRAMEEVLTRRLTAYLADREKPVGRARASSPYPPQLLLVDGGKGQLGVAVKVLEELGLDEEIPVASLAKRFEEVYLPGQSDPVRIPRQSEALYLLQRIRDESHRFAISYHRELRGKRMTTSVLDDIPGLGETRKKRLDQGAGRRRARSQAAELERAAGAAAGCPTRSPAAVYEQAAPDPPRDGRRSSRRGATPRCQTRGRPTPSGGSDEFTDGADPEYDRADPPAGRRAPRRRRAGCSTSAAVRARSPGWPPPAGRRRWSGSTRPRPRSPWPAERAGGPRLLPGLGADALPFADGAVRRRGRLPGVRAHRRRRRGHRRGGPGAARPAAGSCSS